MGTRVEVEQKTYTMDELVGDMPHWWHRIEGEDDTQALCGWPRDGRPWHYVHGDEVICPDCDRIWHLRWGII